MDRNNLYPIFLKITQLNVLIVGGGAVAEEKLGFILKSSPNAKVTLVAPQFKSEIIALSQIGAVTLITKKYRKKYLKFKHIVIGATNKSKVNLKVHKHCKAKQILVNIADTPDYCDFYMGSIVTKGNVKIGISTNGKSPTMAKRMREFFEDVLPENLDELVINLNTYRNAIKGNFEEKVEALNEATKTLIDKNTNS